MEYGWLSLLPPLVAIVLAIASRRVIPSLGLGIVVGVLLLDPTVVDLLDGPPWPPARQLLVVPVQATGSLMETHLWPSLIDEDHLRVFAFTTLMGVMIGLIHRCGGMQGVVTSLRPLAHSRRGGQLLTWALGLVVFIDDYANSLLLGNTMRPLADRLRISREKLAYIVDCTAAPVSGLALISTWIAGEIGYIEAGFEGLSTTSGEVNGFALFVATIPYRFYVILALLFVPIVCLLGRDFGPMLTAERRTLAEGPPPGTGTTSAAESGQAKAADIKPAWQNAVIPIVVTLLITGGLLYRTGYDASREVAGWFDFLMNTFGNGNSYLALLYGSLGGALVAAWLCRAQAKLPLATIKTAAFAGARSVLGSLVILWLAWTLSKQTELLQTGPFLGGLLTDPQQPQWMPDAIFAAARWIVSPAAMPSLVFIVASLVAFSTGTSWGTMGILMPIVIPAAAQLIHPGGGPVEAEGHLMLAVVGSVLSGAIFGDHCSPISDTTVLSSQASGCPHIAHVRTQLPYALLVGIVAIICGTLPVGLGVSPWLLLPIGVTVLVVFQRGVGRRVA